MKITWKCKAERLHPPAKKDGQYVKIDFEAFDKQPEFKPQAHFDESALYACSEWWLKKHRWLYQRYVKEIKIENTEDSS